MSSIDCLLFIRLTPKLSATRSTCADCKKKRKLSLGEHSEVAVCLATRRVINIYKWEPFRFNLLNWFSLVINLCRVEPKPNLRRFTGIYHDAEITSYQPLSLIIHSPSPPVKHLLRWRARITMQRLLLLHWCAQSSSRMWLSFVIYMQTLPGAWRWGII